VFWRENAAGTEKAIRLEFGYREVRLAGFAQRPLCPPRRMAMFFTMVCLGQQIKLAILCHHALSAAKRLLGIPDFRYYAIADGIRKILAGRQTQTFAFASTGDSDSAQADMLDLFGLCVT